MPPKKGTRRGAVKLLATEFHPVLDANTMSVTFVVFCSIVVMASDNVRDIHLKSFYISATRVSEGDVCVPLLGPQQSQKKG